MNLLCKNRCKVMSIIQSHNNDLLHCYTKLINNEIKKQTGYIKSVNYTSYDKNINYILISDWKSKKDWNNWYKSNTYNLYMNISEVKFNTPTNQIKEEIYIIDT